MIESLTSQTITSGSSFNTGVANPADVQTFNHLMTQGNQVEGAISSFVTKAEDRIERGDLKVASQLKDFDHKDDVMSLVTAIHESSMNSISVQLTGKIGTQVAQNFESLIKQQ